MPHGGGENPGYADNLMTRLLLPAILLTAAAFAQTDEWTSARPDGHAPIGVMGDHTHEKGEIMLSYRTMWMGMDGSRVGSDEVSNSLILSPSVYDFKVTPKRMPMLMHMAGIMYAPTNRLTLMAMFPVLSITMDHVTRTGGMFSTGSGGMGDMSLQGMYVLGRFRRQQVHLNMGVSLPTGSITERDITPVSAPNQARLPYPMQLGSGTYDILPGLTYLAQSDNWSGGAQFRATVRTGKNNAGYRLGDRAMATAWVARKWNDWWSTSVRFTSDNWGNIDGADPSFAGAVASRMVPTVFPNLRGGRMLMIGGGVNTYIRRARPYQVRLAVEVSKPVYQNLDGPQLQNTFQVVLGTQLLF